MAGKLIAFESDNKAQLAQAATFLARTLRAEGQTVEVFSFPQNSHASAHFVNAYEHDAYGSVSPYVASMFYALDRFESAHKIKTELAKGSVVIVAGYIGSTLAIQGSHFADATVRRGYYIWADSLETGTFGVPRADLSLVLSEDLATFTELCELFPKDYHLIAVGTNIREAVAQLIPITNKPEPIQQIPNPVEHVSKKITHAYLYDVLNSLNGRQAPEIISFKHEYKKIEGINSSQEKQYRKGMVKLAGQRKDIIKSAAKLGVNKNNINRYLTPLATEVKVAGLHTPASNRTKQKSVFEALMDEYAPKAYTSEEQPVQLYRAHPRNELEVLSDVLFETTDLNRSEIEKAINKMDYQLKTKLLEAYMDDTKSGRQTGHALSRIRYTATAVASYDDLLKLKNHLRSMKIVMQLPTPRFGYSIPRVYERLGDAIERYYDEALSLNSSLSNSNAAPYCVLLGHKGRAQLTFDIFTTWKLINLQIPDVEDGLQQLVVGLKNILEESHPVLLTK